MLSGGCLVCVYILEHTYTIRMYTHYGSVLRDVVVVLTPTTKDMSSLYGISHSSLPPHHQNTNIL